MRFSWFLPYCEVICNRFSNKVALKDLVSQGKSHKGTLWNTGQRTVWQLYPYFTVAISCVVLVLVGYTYMARQFILRIVVNTKDTCVIGFFIYAFICIHIYIYVYYEPAYLLLYILWTDFDLFVRKMAYRNT